MNKSDLIELISIRTGVSKKKVELIINFLIDKITDEVQKGNEVEIRGFGTFYQLTQEKRRIKSPIAGKTIDVPAKKKINFKASKNTEKEIE
ncbi:MAG: HU family DNA-binding protein [Leptospirales bacterium]|nr:HU family DNA-binding protein [Leptospirales bacterium]